MLKGAKHQTREYGQLRAVCGKNDNPSPVVGKVRELSRDGGRFERKTNLTPNSDNIWNPMKDVFFVFLAVQVSFFVTLMKIV